MAVNYIGVGRFAVALENKTVPAQNCQLEVNQLLSLKKCLQEWKTYMSNGYDSFLQSENTVLNWYERESLLGATIFL